LLLAAKPICPLDAARVYQRFSVSRIILTQKNFAVSMNSIPGAQALISLVKSHAAASFWHMF
jgi:hypothetical protein